MTLEQYQDLTGISVTSTNEVLVNSMIDRTQRILETMLGYTLDTDLVDDNFYTEIGKVNDDCPCYLDVDEDNLQAPDAVNYAYRLFPYNYKDKYLIIDPATEVYAVKLVKDGVTFSTLDTDDYRVHFQRGVAKYIERCDRWCGCGDASCQCVQLAVDAEWLWQDTFPDDLLAVWADMVTYYSDTMKDVKSQTLGTHSYTLRDKRLPESEEINVKILQKYAGPLGTLTRTVTV